MKSKTLLTAKVSFMLMVFYAVLCCCLFIPAGTMRFYNGWIYFGIFFFWVNLLTFYFLSKNPQLIERRTQGEKEKVQQVIQSLNGLLFLAMLIIPGIDFRYRFSCVPLWLVVLSAIFVSLGFLIVFFVFKQNSYLASNIKAYQNQTVISTGLYSLVRHPMYSGAYLIILFGPLVLGSWLALLPAFMMGVLIILRTLNEEKVLSRDLNGYTAYCKQVRYRYFPWVW
ncbi:methyltransferase family protein [Mucilaginibacter lappiensis]|uniref:Protein-S-isoprenylcysteine O-methyltransferase Ste14 n=1 Tax=Mucilaginibacter lappiensis TaxID=354630 RepID=A0A841JM83_9SPHI|nr:isoprenylcysteine carboxylmethyltransferase family protein [Mucilaginibacter lappiensis]MBB6129021.1 protein-S-isoprenylcysteine O-methyltransferase Ste14 [Mucilaginibacter lappiensis]